MSKLKNLRKKPTRLAIPTAGKITRMEFCRHHYNNMQLHTDMYYVGVANQIYEHFQQMNNANLFSLGVLRKISLMLTAYLEDLVSGQGLWSAFCKMSKKRYGNLPFSNSARGGKNIDEYPTPYGVGFLIWYCIDDDKKDTFVNPENPIINLFTLSVMPLLDTAFDEAPDTAVIFPLAPEEKSKIPLVHQVKKMCIWIYRNAYLTQLTNLGECVDYGGEFFKGVLGNAGSESVDYAVEAYMAFNIKTGPLSALPQEWLAVMLDSDVYGEEGKEYAKLIKKLKVRPVDVYKIIKKNEDEARLVSVEGVRLTLSAYNMPNDKFPDQFEANRSAIVALINFEGRWIQNGVAQLGLPLEVYTIMKNQYEAAKKQGEDAYESLLRHFNGKRVGVAADFDEYLNILPIADAKLAKQFRADFPDDLKKAKNILYFLCSDGQLTMLADWGACVKIRGNKCYDKKKAMTDGFMLIVDHKLTTDELREYMIEHNLIPDAALNSLVSAEHGRKLFQNNIRFINDYFSRGETKYLSTGLLKKPLAKSE